MNKMLFALPLAMALGCVPAAAQEAGPKVLVKEVLAGMPKLDQQEIKVLAGTLPPGGTTPFHTHQYPVTVYVQGGHVHARAGRPPAAGEKSRRSLHRAAECEDDRL
jgi:quercetin dioxygenase-like cupin family protein